CAAYAGAGAETLALAPLNNMPPGAFVNGGGVWVNQGQKPSVNATSNALRIPRPVVGTNLQVRTTGRLQALPMQNLPGAIIQSIRDGVPVVAVIPVTNGLVDPRVAGIRVSNRPITNITHAVVIDRVDRVKQADGTIKTIYSGLNSWGNQPQGPAG